MRYLYTIHFNIGVSTRSFVTVTILYRVFSLQSSRVTCVVHVTCLHVHGLGADLGVGGPGVGA